MTQHLYLVAGPIWLDAQDERVWKDGRPVKLGGKAFLLLRTLMERPRTLVTKRELFDSVWLGLAVSDAVLTTAVKEIRQALGDDARAPHFLETVHGRGYRFLLDVETVDELPAKPADTTSPSRRRTWMIAGAIAIALLALAAALVVLLPLQPRPAAPDGEAEFEAHPKSIAVLPFEDLSQGGDQGWFAAGLTEEILNSLARTPDLHVAARTSTLGLGPGDVRELGRRLNVAHILEGSVRRDERRVRVTAQLIRTSDGFHLWSQNYDREAADIVSIQEDIAFAIAHALKTVMAPESLQAMVRLGTRSVEAYEAYLRGLAFDRRALASGADADVELAFQAYERARSIDPAFAAAHWAAARGWFGNATRVGSMLTERRGSEEARLREYLVRVDDAIRASRGQPEQFRYRSARLLMDLRFRDALRLMSIYLRRRPRDVGAWEEIVDLAGYAEDRPFMAHAAQRIHALSIESGAPLSRAITASVLAMDIRNAVRRAREQLRLRPDEALIQYQAHRALLWGGHEDEARIVLGRMRGSELPAENIALAELRQACADGDPDAARIAASMAGLADASTSGAWHSAMLLGETDRAYALLEPLHRPEHLRTLMQFLVYPTFDASRFPLLAARLRADGIPRGRPVRIPFACPARPASAANPTGTPVFGAPSGARIVATR